MKEFLQKFAMFTFLKRQEPPLHQAVLSNDLDKVLALRSKKDLSRQTNSWGYTAQEIAAYLGKDNLVNLLSRPQSKVIKVIWQGDTNIQHMSKDQFSKLFGVKYCSHLQFSSYKAFTDAISECPLILKYTAIGEENRQLGRQYRQALFDGYIANTFIQWVSLEKGYGLFASKEIEKGEYIGEYTGHVRRLYRKNPDKNSFCFHYPTRFWSWKFMMVDSQTMGNETRFINHDDEPNLKPVCLIDRGLLHICFFAVKAIAKGAELTFDYGKDYWRKNISKSRH